MGCASNKIENKENTTPNVKREENEKIDKKKW